MYDNYNRKARAWRAEPFRLPLRRLPTLKDHIEIITQKHIRLSLLAVQDDRYSGAIHVEGEGGRRTGNITLGFAPMT